MTLAVTALVLCLSPLSVSTAAAARPMTKAAHVPHNSSVDTDKAMQIDRSVDLSVIDDEAIEHLDLAKYRLDHDDSLGAADQFRKAVFFLMIYASKADDDVAIDLQNAAEKIDALADKADDNAVDRAKDINQPYAETFLALSRYHYLAAINATTRHDTNRMKTELASLADYLAKAYEFSGHAMDQTTRELIAEVLKKTRPTAAPSAADLARFTTELGHRFDLIAHEIAPASH